MASTKQREKTSLATETIDFDLAAKTIFVYVRL